MFCTGKFNHDRNRISMTFSGNVVIAKRKYVVSFRETTNRKSACFTLAVRYLHTFPLWRTKYERAPAFIYICGDIDIGINKNFILKSLSIGISEEFERTFTAYEVDTKRFIFVRK